MTDSPRFRTVMRGYEPSQVEQRIGDLELGALRADVARWREAARLWDESGEPPALPLPRLG